MKKTIRVHIILAIIMCFASVTIAYGKCLYYLARDYGLITKRVSILGVFWMAIFLDGSYLVEHKIKNFYPDASPKLSAYEQRDDGLFDLAWTLG